MSRFVQPASLDEALEALSRGDAKSLAGGTDLMVALRKARLQGGDLPATLVDLTRLPELQRIRLDGDEPYLGAGLTFRFLESNPAVARRLPLLARAAASVGSVQVRSTATIGGNVANASPAADGLTALTALEASAEIASPRGQRFCPLHELITAPNQTTLAEDEIILGFRLALPPDPDGQAFLKVGRRHEVAVARLNLAVALDRSLEDPRVVLGSCFPSPHRMIDVENLLHAGQPGPDLWQHAGEIAASHFTDVCGWRSSADYKVPAITRCTAQALSMAWSGLEAAS
ncbi:MAG: FAD binding domain-containing protein [Desulfarculaceae bacterium]|nr:FAD binding domain-containing protein [Desulfarculaceae bacterium]